MGLEDILAFTIVVDMNTGECDINYPVDTNLTEFEMISMIRQIVTTCYMDMRNDKLNGGEHDEYRH